MPAVLSHVAALLVSVVHNFGNEIQRMEHSSGIASCLDSLQSNVGRECKVWESSYKRHTMCLLCCVAVIIGTVLPHPLLSTDSDVRSADCRLLIKQHAQR